MDIVIGPPVTGDNLCGRELETLLSRIRNSAFRRLAGSVWTGRRAE